MNKLFVVIVRYIADLSEIETHLDAHRKFLGDNYKNGVFIVSGPQIPRSGGIILAKCESRKLLEQILSKDSFAEHKLAEYQIYEFSAAGYTPAFEAILK
jgi:uncharacterized protein YciI